MAWPMYMKARGRLATRRRSQSMPTCCTTRETRCGAGGKFKHTARGGAGCLPDWLAGWLAGRLGGRRPGWLAFM